MYPRRGAPSPSVHCTEHPHPIGIGRSPIAGVPAGRGTGEGPVWVGRRSASIVSPAMGSLIKKRRKRMRKKKHKKLLRRTRHQRRARGK